MGRSIITYIYFSISDGEIEELAKSMKYVSFIYLLGEQTTLLHEFSFYFLSISSLDEENILLLSFFRSKISRCSAKSRENAIQQAYIQTCSTFRPKDCFDA